jgi:hypothetical protein
MSKKLLSIHPSLGVALGVSVFSSVLLLSGCAQSTDSTFYSLPPSSASQAATVMSEGASNQPNVQAPSQVQVRWSSSSNSSQSAPQQVTVKVAGQTEYDSLSPAGQQQMQQQMMQDAGAPPSIFNQPETFFGTLPCFHQDMGCNAQRVTLTLAPNGRWRARSNYLENDKASGLPLASQGCWRAVAASTPRLVLLDPKGVVRAELAMTSQETFRLISINGQTPNLTYTLSRQPDLDPISELNSEPTPRCN